MKPDPSDRVRIIHALPTDKKHMLSYGSLMSYAAFLSFALGHQPCSRARSVLFSFFALPPQRSKYRKCSYFSPFAMHPLVLPASFSQRLSLALLKLGLTFCESDTVKPRPTIGRSSWSCGSLLRKTKMFFGTREWAFRGVLRESCKLQRAYHCTAKLLLHTTWTETAAFPYSLLYVSNHEL